MKKSATLLPRVHWTFSDQAFHLLPSCREASWNSYSILCNYEESMLYRWDSGVHGGKIIAERAVLNPACSYLEVPLLSKYIMYFDLCCLLPKLWILASQKTKSQTKIWQTKYVLWLLKQLSSWRNLMHFRRHRSAVVTNYLYLNQKSGFKFTDEEPLLQENWNFAVLFTDYLKWCSERAWIQPKPWMKCGNPTLVQSDLWSQPWTETLCYRGVSHSDSHAELFLKARICPLCHIRWIMPQVTVLQANSLIWDEIGL